MRRREFIAPRHCVEGRYPTPQALACWDFSFAKLKRCRVMDVLRLVATSTNRDGIISGPVVVLTPGGAVISHNFQTR
jgi:hypothetical protein